MSKSKHEENVEEAITYRVRKTWDDSETQKGGVYKVLKNAKACADKNPGYSVFDENGNVVYETENIDDSNSDTPDNSVAFTPYKVRVTAPVLKVRSGPGKNYKTIRLITDKGIYEIISESIGIGASKWGELRSGSEWISLDYGLRA